MDQHVYKIARKFKVNKADAVALIDAGLDTPTKIKAQAKARKKLPTGVAAKLHRWRDAKATE